MTPEEQLKQVILSKYKSVRAFTTAIGIPYTTLDSVFKRGIANSGVSTMIKVFNALGLDIESALSGTIQPKGETVPPPSEPDPAEFAEKYRSATREARIIAWDLLNLSSDEQKVVARFLHTVANGFDAAPPKPPRKMSRSEAHAELDRQLDLEERGAEELLGSGRGSSGTGAG